MSAPDGGSLIRPPDPVAPPGRNEPGTARRARTEEDWRQGLAPVQQASNSAADIDLARRVRAYSMASADLFQQEQALITTGKGLPDLRNLLGGKAVVVLADLPGPQTRTAIRRLLGARASALVAVGAGGIAASKALRLRPAVIIGDPGEAGLRLAQRAKATVLLRHPDGGIAGAQLLRSNSLGYDAVPTSLNELDVALLLAAHSGAQLVVHQVPGNDLHHLVTEGSNVFNAHLLVLAQLQDVLISARSLAVLQRPSLASWLLVLMVLAALAVLAAAIWLTPWGQSLLPWAAAGFTDWPGRAAGWI